MDWESMDFTQLANQADPFPVLESMKAMTDAQMMNPALAGGGEVGSGYPASAPGAAPKPPLAPLPGGGMAGIIQPQAPAGPAPSAAPQRPGPIALPGSPQAMKKPPTLHEILYGRSL